MLCLTIPLAVGRLSALLTRTGMESFALINKPSLTPPDWLFPVAWTILYIFMGFASYLVVISEKPNRSALTVYAIQLAFNLFWSILFFNLKLYLLSLAYYVMAFNCCNSVPIPPDSKTNLVFPASLSIMGCFCISR